MSDHNPVLSVVVISLLIFVFFKFCLGDRHDLNYLDNQVPTSADRPANGSKCPPGFVYNTYTRRCKQLVLSNKKFTDRLLLLMPYFAQQAHAHQ